MLSKQAIAIRVLAALALAGLAAGTAPAAEKEPTGPFGGNISGTVAGTTDYTFRGISQTSEEPAVQAALEYALPLPILGDSTQAYLGVWGSNVKFTDASLEADITGGVRGAVGKLGWDANVIWYTYPGADSVYDYNYWEVGGALKYDFGIAIPRIGLRYSPDFFAGSGSAWYAYAGADIPLPFLTDYSPRITGQIGRQWIDDNARAALPDYTDWTVGVGFSAFTLDFLLAYVDTSVSKSWCAELCDARAVFTVSKAF